MPTRRAESLSRQLAAISQNLTTPGMPRAFVGTRVDIDYVKGGVLGWSKVDKTFSIEASQLRDWTPGDPVTIHNPKTGGSMVFGHGRNFDTQRDNDNDVMWWRLRGENGVTLIIFND
jgi:hypothetical protein